MLRSTSDMAHIPQRTCVICRKKRAKNNLLRFILLPSNKIIYDLKQNLPSRGYYCCDDNDCLTKLDRWRKKRK